MKSTRLLSEKLNFHRSIGRRTAFERVIELLDGGMDANDLRTMIEPRIVGIKRKQALMVADIKELENEENLTHFANYIKSTFGGSIDSAIIRETWENLFGEVIEDEAIENIISVLVFTYKIEVG